MALKPEPARLAYVFGIVLAVAAILVVMADRLLDLALGAHSEPLEELANAAVEHVFVHDRLRYVIINVSKVPTGRGAEIRVGHRIRARQ